MPSITKLIATLHFLAFGDSDSDSLQCTVAVSSPFGQVFSCAVIAL